jgi:hypothetical protein
VGGLKYISAGSHYEGDLKSIVKRSAAGERRAGLCTVQVYPNEAIHETLKSVSFGLTIEI